jgi:hypothetical protein
MRETTVTCDACGRDISTTTNCVDFRLALTTERLPAESDVVTLMHISQPIGRDHHFCGVRCLTAWVESDDRTP